MVRGLIQSLLERGIPWVNLREAEGRPGPNRTANLVSVGGKLLGRDQHESMHRLRWTHRHLGGLLSKMWCTQNDHRKD